MLYCKLWKNRQKRRCVAAVLKGYKNPEDLKNMDNKKLKILAEEIREYVIDAVSQNGGHLASNLGAVEITLALLKVFDFKKDNIVFDVGHQSYVYKILTDRKEQFKTLRKYKGISGFPRISESEYDHFNAGHAGTAISAAYAMAEVNRKEKNGNFSVAFVGDASLCNGLSFEGLNNAGQKPNKLLVILNDNEMSIKENVGSVSNYLNNLRITPAYTRLKENIKHYTTKIPVLGKPISKFSSALKYGVKKLLITSGIMFENFGFKYIGPIDGHDTDLLIKILSRIKNMDSPVLLHIITKKGKGYEFAEKTPELYHGVGKFDKTKPITIAVNEKSPSYIAGRKLLSLAEKDENIIAVCAAMEDGCGLAQFHKKLPERFYDVGISEGHAVTFAAGLAAKGKIPVVAIYSTFMQRAYDNIVHDMAISNLHCVLLLDRAGISGEDGETHQGIFDINFLSTIPNVTIFTPSNKEELEDAIEKAIYETKGIVAVRYGKHNFEEGEKTDLLKGRIVKKGNKATIVTYSKMTEVVKTINPDADHIHLNCVSHIDYDCITKSLEKTKNLVVAEDSIKNGGVGEKICAYIAQKGITAKCKIFAVENRFVPHGTVEELLKDCEIDGETIERYINETEA